jgi:iron complex transport system substrate-binding protein
MLPAVRAGQVWLADGPAYFNRCGPRIVDAIERLAELLDSGRPSTGIFEPFDARAR